MDKREVIEELTQSVNTFKSKYPEWKKYELLVHTDEVFIEVKGQSGKLSVEAADELLKDFASVLKQNNLMVTEKKGSKVMIDEYTYTVEVGLEDLADELELKLGKQFTNLEVSEKNGKPHVSYLPIGNQTSQETEKLKKAIVDIVNEYEAIDEDDIFGEIEFDDFDEITEQIEEEQLDTQLEEN